MSTFFTFCVLLNISMGVRPPRNNNDNKKRQTRRKNKYAPTAVERICSREKNSQSTATYFELKRMYTVQPTKRLNEFSLIDNIHRSSEVSRLQTSPISLDRNYCFEECYRSYHHQISKTTLTIWFCFYYYQIYYTARIHDFNRSISLLIHENETVSVYFVKQLFQVNLPV